MALGVFEGGRDGFAICKLNHSLRLQQEAWNTKMSTMFDSGRATQATGYQMTGSAEFGSETGLSCFSGLSQKGFPFFAGSLSNREEVGLERTFKPILHSIPFFSWLSQALWSSGPSGSMRSLEGLSKRTPPKTARSLDSRLPRIKKAHFRVGLCRSFCIYLWSCL